MNSSLPTLTPSDRLILLEDILDNTSACIRRWWVRNSIKENLSDTNHPLDRKSPTNRDGLLDDADELSNTHLSSNSLSYEDLENLSGDRAHCTTYFLERWSLQYQSTGCASIYGYSSEELLKRCWLDQVIPEDREHILLPGLKQVLTQPQTTIDYRIRHRDGSLRWVSQTFSVQSQNTGWQVTGIETDITDRQTSLQPPQPDEQTREVILNFDHVGSWEWHLESGAMQTSTGGAQIIGLQTATPQHQYHYQDWRDRVHPDDLGWVEDRVAQALVNRTDFVAEYRVVHSDGSVHWIYDRGRSLYDETGTAVRMAGVVIDTSDRKQLELALQRSEIKLNQILNNLNASIVSMHVNDDGTWHYDFCSQGAEQVFGLLPQDMKEQKHSWRDRVHPDDLPLVTTAEQVDRALVSQTEYRFFHTDGTLRWISNNLTSRRDPTNQCWIVTVVDVDITELKQAQLAVEEKEAQYRSVFESTTDALHIFDLETGALVEANLAACQMHGYSYEEFLSLHPGQFVHPDYQALFRQFIEQVRSGRSFHCEAKNIHRNGTAFDIEVHGTGLLYKGKPHILSIVQDITDRKRAELALRESEERLRRILQNMPVMLNAADETYNFVVWNQECERVTGYQPHELLHNPEALPLLYPDPEYRQQMMDTWAKIGNNFRNWELQLTAKDGSPRTVAWSNLSEQFPIAGWSTWAIGVDVTEQKQTEAALRESEARFQRIAANVPGVLYQYISHPDGSARFSYISPRCREMYGLEPEAVVEDERTMWSLVHLDDVPLMQASIAEATRTMQRWSCEHRIITVAGELKWLRASSDPQRQPNGDIVWDGMIVDVSDRKTAEIALQNLVAGTASMTGAEFFPALVQNLAEILNVRHALVAEWVDHQCQTIALWADQQLRPNIYYDPSDGPCAYTYQEGIFYCASCVQQQFPTNSTLAMLEAESYLGVALIDATGYCMGHLCVLDDQPLVDRSNLEAILRVFAARATAELERQRATTALQNLNQELEQRVQARTAQLQMALSAARMGTWEWDIATHVQQWSPENYELMGFQTDDTGRVLDHNGVELSPYPTNEVFLSRVHPDDLPLLLAAEQRSRQEQTMYEIEYRLLWWDGTVRWRLCRGAWVHDDQGKSVRLTGVGMDVTDRKQAEDQLRQMNERLVFSNAELAQATRLKDEFLANMSHELRTPLNAILGLSEVLQETAFGPLTDKQRQFLSTIQSSGNHLLDLINDVLDLAKIEAGKLELHFNPVCIDYLCESSVMLVEQQAHQKGIQLRVEVTPLPTTIAIDERRIRQVLVNLLSNAVKFTPNGGQVSLTVQPHLASTAPGITSGVDSLTFSVIDTGIGIAEHDLPKLFQTFVQIDSGLSRQYEGTGLGLALVKQIVELHGGRVNVESSLGQGSRFMVTLPCDRDRLASQSEPTELNFGCSSIGRHSVSGSSFNPPLILLAEDTPDNILTLVEFLQLQNYQVIVAYNGEEAVQMAITHQPDLILMDVQMPGMNGLEAIRQVRSAQFTMPILALTALVMPGDREKCLAAGATDYLTKPIGLSQLSMLIRQRLSR